MARFNWMILGMIFGLWILSRPFPAASEPAGDIDRRIEQPVRESITTRQASQKETEKWQSDREELLARFDQLEEESRRLEAEAETLRQQVQAADARVAEKERQLAEVRQISDQIQPFLEERIADLARLLSNGPPFLIQERTQRIEKLKSLMIDPSVTISERYRKVMEAWQVEAEYGFTIEVYPETITPDVGSQEKGTKEPLLVDVFRLGRLNLFFQSPDQTVCGFYNSATRAWQTLPTQYNATIRTAIEIGKKSRPVELLSLPLGRMAIQ